MSAISRILALAIFSLAAFARSGAQSTPPPNGLQGVFHQGKVYLSWHDPDSLPPGEHFYNIYRAENGSETFSRAGATFDSTHFVDPLVMLNSVYRYYVTLAIFPDTIESGPSNIAEVHTDSDAGPPQPPTELAGFYNGGSIFLQWRKPVYAIDPSFYKIYRRAIADSVFGVLGTASSTSFADDHPALNTLYQYYVTAVYHDTIESGPSFIVQVRSGRPPGPRNLEGHIENGDALLNWSPPEIDLPILYYNIHRFTFPDSLPGVIGYTSETQFTDSTITLTKEYFYTVTAIYAGDSLESEPSNTVILPNLELGIRFTTTPTQISLINHLFQYDAGVETNPPGHTVCFTLGQAPDGMTVDPSTGLVQWTPLRAGSFEVELNARICDTLFAAAHQVFHILVYSAPPGVVEGMVRNTDGLGLRGVRVKLFDILHGEFVLENYTDDTGHYKFPLVNPSTYLVRARPDSEQYLPQWYNGAAELSDATPVVVPESTTVTVDFTIQRATIADGPFTLSGSVYDLAHAPLPGARIMVFRIVNDRPVEDLLDGEEGDHDLVSTMLTDMDGRYFFVLPAGHYIVGALKEQYYPQFWDHRNSPLEATVIHLAQDTGGINFDLKPSGDAHGLLSGTLFSAVDSSRLRGLVLGFHKPAPDSAFSGIVLFTHTDLMGNYLLQGMPDGYYVILGLPRGEFVPTFYSTSGGTPLHDSATSVAVAGDSVGGIDIYSRPDSVQGLNAVIGRVNAGSPGSTPVPSSIDPVAGAVITIVSPDNRTPVGSAITHSDGSYAVAGLAPGSYTIIFQKPGKGTASAIANLAYINNIPSMLTVNAQLADQPGGTGGLGSMNLQNSWNLLSLPVTVADRHLSSVFPTAASPAFRYDQSMGYVQSDLLDYHNGYWLRFSAIQAMTLQGSARALDTIPLRLGWNLIGTISSTLPVSSIQTIPPNLLYSRFFTHIHNQGYAVAYSLEPGKGYWIKASGDGVMVLHAGTATPKEAGADARALAGLSSLTIRDAQGNYQTLYFGIRNGSIEPGDYAVPPLPPPGAFDVRFASQSLLQLHPAVIPEPEQFPILVQSAGTPLTISWSIQGGGPSYRLRDATGKLLTAKLLSGNGSVTTDQPSVDKLFLETASAQVPKKFALYQNYPNPFNPATRISFDVPVPAVVTLKVFDILGEEVEAVLKNESFDAGVYTITFDASRYPSGVYIYRLTSDALSQPVHFISVKKMVLVR
jgi:fibronectin type 3 domain-containing protein